MFKLFTLSLLVFSSFVYGKCMSTPTYLVDAEILSCKEDILNEVGSSTLNVKVISEKQFYRFPPFDVKDESIFTVVNKEIEVVLPNVSLPCHMAMHRKLDQSTISIIMYRVCCDVTQDICANANSYLQKYVYRGVLNSNLFNTVKSSPPIIDGSFNFSKEDLSACPVHNKPIKRD